MTPFTPREYQHLARDFIVATKRCALYMSMGMGKTSAVLLALKHLTLVCDPYPVLVVAPVRVARKTWREEIAKWSDFHGLTISEVVGTAQERTAALAFSADIYTINYENLQWLLKVLPKDRRFATIVIDESSKLKNFRGSIQTHHKTGKRFLRCDSGAYAGALAKLTLRADRVIELTGTPAPNGLINLWAQVWFLDGGARLGRTFTDFEQRWFRTAPNGYGLVPLPNADEEIHERIRDICLTIDPKDWFSLREPIRQRIEVELPTLARKLYRDMERDLFLRIADTEVEAMSAASKSIKCLQLANGAIYTDSANSLAWAATHDEKLDALEDIIEEASGMPVLVAYHFRSDLARLQHRFPQARVLQTTKDEDDFKAGRIPILLCHPESAGHGIDGFQYATNIIVFFGHWWDLEPRQQMIERIGPVRQMQAGLDRPVFIYDIVAKDTIDEQVMLRHETKREVQDILLDALRDNERIFS